MSDAVLVFDLGTTRLKAAVFDPDGTLLGMEACRHVEHRDGPHVWQNADAWWSDTLRLGQRVTSRVTDRRFVAVSLSGRGGAAVFADASGEVLVHPWSDNRHRAELAELGTWREEGMRLSTYGAALIAKHRWLRSHEPMLASRITRACYGKDFLLFRLCGAHLTDPSSGPDALGWDPPVLTRAAVPSDLLPEPAVPWHVAGRLNDAVARALELPLGTPVVVGAHDGICANVGAGAAGCGRWALTLGTHAVARVVLDHVPNGVTRFYGLPPDRHVIGGNALYAGFAPDWFLDVATDPPGDQGVGEHRAGALEKLDAEAAAVPPGARGVRFLPFLGGRVAPERRPRASGSFTGMRMSHTRTDLYRAVLEGAAFAIRDVYGELARACGAAPSMRLTGSGAASAPWTTILADVLRVPLEVTDTAVEGRGAAIFAAIALGRFADYDAAADHMVHVTRRVLPDEARATLYDEIYAHWRDVERITRALDAATVDPPRR